MADYTTYELILNGVHEMAGSDVMEAVSASRQAHEALFIIVE